MPGQSQDIPPFDSPDLVLGTDGLPIREVGVWSKDKHHFLRRYVDVFTTSMKGKWSGLGYIDIFAGPGMCKIRDTGEEIDGSPLIALASPKRFDAFFFGDKSKDALAALQTRFLAQNAHVLPKLFVGDCNITADTIARALDPSALHLAFIDPTGLHVHFDTIRKLTARHKVDLIISVMDRLDLVRNIQKYYYPKRDSNLDAFLGREVDWRRAYDSLPDKNASHVSHLVLDLYQRQLQSIGYSCFGDRKRIAGTVPYYLLFFASKHPRGANLWNKTSGKDRGGQRSFQW